MRRKRRRWANGFSALGSKKKFNWNCPSLLDRPDLHWTIHRPVDVQRLQLSSPPLPMGSSIILNWGPLHKFTLMPASRWRRARLAQLLHRHLRLSRSHCYYSVHQCLLPPCQNLDWFKSINKIGYRSCLFGLLGVGHSIPSINLHIQSSRPACVVRSNELGIMEATSVCLIASSSAFELHKKCCLTTVRLEAPLPSFISFDFPSVTQHFLLCI